MAKYRKTTSTWILINPKCTLCGKILIKGDYRGGGCLCTREERRTDRGIDRNIDYSITGELNEK